MIQVIEKFFVYQLLIQQIVHFKNKNNGILELCGTIIFTKFLFVFKIIYIKNPVREKTIIND